MPRLGGGGEGEWLGEGREQDGVSTGGLAIF